MHKWGSDFSVIIALPLQTLIFLIIFILKLNYMCVTNNIKAENPLYLSLSLQSMSLKVFLFNINILKVLMKCNHVFLFCCKQSKTLDFAFFMIFLAVSLFNGTGPNNHINSTSTSVKYTCFTILLKNMKNI